MSKKKRSKKRERIPVIDTLIDLAGAMTLDYLAHTWLPVIIAMLGV